MKLFKNFVNTRVFSVGLSVICSIALVAFSASAATTISTNIDTGGTLAVTGASTLTGAVTMSAAATVGTDLTVTSGARIGTGSSGGHLTALADDSLFVEGQSEFDGIAWFDGILHASSTALFGGVVVTYDDVTVGSGLRVGTGSSGGHITALAADSLFIEGQSEFDGITWFDGQFQASSTALFGDTATFYGAVNIGGDALGTDFSLFTDTAGEELLWDASENKLSLDGADGTTVFEVTDGNVVITDNLTVSGTFSPAITAIGANLTVPADYSLDVAAAGTLNIGTTTATAITIGKAGITTTNAGALTVSQAATLSSTLSVTSLATFLGGATTTSLTLLNGETITNAVDGTVAVSGTLSSATTTATTALVIPTGTTPSASDSCADTANGAIRIDTDAAAGSKIIACIAGTWTAN